MHSPASTIRDVDRAHMHEVERGDGYVIYTDQNSLVVHLHMVPVDHWTLAYVVSTQKADAMARRIRPGVRLEESLEYGVVAADNIRRVYR